MLSPTHPLDGAGQPAPADAGYTMSCVASPPPAQESAHDGDEANFMEDNERPETPKRTGTDPQTSLPAKIRRSSRASLCLRTSYTPCARCSDKIRTS